MTKINEEVTTLGRVPALVATDAAAAAEKLPAVLLLHGLGASKEVQRNEAHALARRGFRAISLDAFGHGARRFPGFDQRFTPDRAERSYFECVERSAQEIPGVLLELEQGGWADRGVGACGISMGGAILYGALASGCTFASAAMIVASPRWLHVDVSPHQRPERFFPTPLLIQAAGADTVVSPEDGRTFWESLVPHYATAPDRLRYIEHPGEGHLFSGPGWVRAWAEVMQWFDRFLRPDASP